jgi:nicotinamide-nucleotide adenylyltransferase
MKERALMIGRFQPFHKGHLEVVRKIARECSSVTIGIGSAQYSHTLENPFTAGERHLMISSALEEDGIENYYLVPVVDINRYAVWVAHVVSMVPPFEVVYTNNPLTRRLFSEAGWDVRDSPMFNRAAYSGTEIRRRIASGEGWEDSVPPGVASAIKAIGGVGRMKDLSGISRGDDAGGEEPGEGA